MRDGLARLLKHSDLAAAGVVVVVVVMMIVSLPPVPLDLLITLNITAALAILVATTYMPRPLDFAAFPSLLLLATLFRLAINDRRRGHLPARPHRRGGDGRPRARPARGRGGRKGARPGPASRRGARGPRDRSAGARHRLRPRSRGRPARRGRPALPGRGCAPADRRRPRDRHSRRRIHDDAVLDSHEYEVRVRGFSVARGRPVPGHRLAINPGEGVPPIGGIPTVEPAFNLPAPWIDESMRGEAEALGYTVVDGESVIVTHLTETIRRSVHELLTRQETKKPLDALKEQNAAAVELLAAVGPDEVHLVLPSAMEDGLAAFVLDAVGTDSSRERLLLTRLDESQRVGSVIGLAIERRIPVSYVSDGPHLDRGMRPADPVNLASMLLR